MVSSSKKRAPYRKTKRLKGNERRRLILEAAQQLLAEQGFSALTLRGAAQAADVRLATLQYYFPTREQLFNAAFENVTDKAWAELLSQVESTAKDKPVDRLRFCLSGLIATTKDGALADMFVELWAAARSHDFASTLMRRYYNQATNLLSSLIKSAYPELPSPARKQRAVLVVSMLEGLTLFRQMDRRERRQPAVSDRTTLASMLSILDA